MRISSLFLLAFCLTLSITADIHAQAVQMTYQVMPPYPVHPEDLIRFRGQQVVTLINSTNESRQIKLLARITGDQGIQAEIKSHYQPVSPILLQPFETRILTGAELESMHANMREQDVHLTGISWQRIAQTETIPEGVYEICVTAHDLITGELLSDPDGGCSTLFITHYDPPVLVYPVEDESVPTTDPQMLNLIWTPSGMPHLTEYRIELVDMTMNRLLDANQAFDNPAIRPFYSDHHWRTTSYPMDVTRPSLIPGHQYAVRIQASDPSGMTAFKNEGKGPVSWFVWGGQDQQVDAFGPGLVLKEKEKGMGGPGGFAENNSPLAQAYKGNDGGAFYVTVKKIGSKNKVYWFGEHPGQGYSHLFEGEVKGNQVEGTFWGVPKYGEPTSGKVTLDIQHNGKSLVVQSKHVDFVPDVLTSIDLKEYIDLFPLARDYAAYSGKQANGDPMTGLFMGTDGGRYYIRQVDDHIYMIGESRFDKGEQPGFMHLFSGQINPYGTKGYDNYFEGYFTTLSKGTKNASGKSAWRIKSSDRINQYGTSDLGCDTLKRAKTGISSPDGPVPVHKDPVDPGGVDAKPKAEKSAAFVLFYFDDGPFATLFQNIGTKLNLALEGYDKTVVMKEDYLGIKADKEVNLMYRTTFLSELVDLAIEGYYIDLYVFTHGSRDGIMLKDGAVTAQDIQIYLGGWFGPGDFPLRMVYQMNCYGSNLLMAFKNAGAKVACGTRNVNFCPTRYNPFAKAWQAGKTFQQAVNDGINDDVANSLAATGININLKWRIGNPLSWDCKSCKVGTDLTDKKNCLGCYFKSFWGFENSEYDYDQTGLWNMFNSSFHIVVGDGSITRNTKPTW